MSKHGTAALLTETLTYRTPTSTTSTGQVAKLQSIAANYSQTLTYTYDANGNIKTVSNGTHTTTYTYDNQNQLIREDNQAGNFTHTWTYDKAGNILSRSKYAYTTGTLGAAQDTVTYDYSTDAWAPPALWVLPRIR